MSLRPTPAKLKLAGRRKGSRGTTGWPAGVAGRGAGAGVSGASGAGATDADGGGAAGTGRSPPHQRRGRSGRLLDQLDPEDGRCDLVLDVLGQLVESLEGLVLVLDQWVLLTEGAQADAFLEVLHHGQVADPLAVDGLEHDELLDLAHHVRRDFRLLGLVSG